MQTEKVYVNLDDDTAMLKCPKCGTAKIGYVGKYKGSKRSVKVRCRCQSAFDVLFEFRRAHRKDTNIQGYYAKLAEGEDWRKIVVTNISLTGIGLLSNGMHNLNMGDELKLRFNLDDPRRSKIEKEAVVKWAEDVHIGCEFIMSVSYDETSDKALDFYLMP